jgi:TonB family protein
MNRAISILLFTFCFCINAAVSQQTVHPGIALYEEGKNAEAIRSLAAAVKTKEFEKNAEVWNFLGLSYIKASDFNKAKKSIEKAIKLTPLNSIYRSNLAYAYLMSRQNAKALSEARKAIELDPKNATAYYFRGSVNLLDNKLSDAEKDADNVLTIAPTYPQGYVLKANILVARLGQKVVAGSTPKAEIKYLQDAVEVLKKGVESSKNSPNQKLVVQELEAIDVFYKHFSKANSETGRKPEPDPSVTPLKVTVKPEPSYTNSARQAGVRGTIQVAVLFGAGGKVEKVLLLKRLGSGLDENVISAAYKLGFEPQKKDGKPISVVRIVEYGFDID